MAGSSDEEEKRENVEVGLNNLSIEMAGIEEEEAEQLEAVLGMEFNREREGEGEVEEGGDGTQRALGALEFLTHNVEPSGTILVDARNGFTELSRLAMLCTVRHS